MKSANADLQAEIKSKEESEASLVRMLDSKRKTIQELQDSLNRKNAKMHKLKMWTNTQLKSFGSSKMPHLLVSKLKEKHAQEIQDLQDKLDRFENKGLTERTVKAVNVSNLESRVEKNEKKIGKIEQIIHRRTFSSPDSWLTTTALTHKMKKRKNRPQKSKN